MRQYRVVKEDSVEEFINKCNAYLAGGAEPLGGLCVAVRTHGPVYMQAFMIESTHWVSEHDSGDDEDGETEDFVSPLDPEAGPLSDIEGEDEDDGSSEPPVDEDWQAAPTYAIYAGSHKQWWDEEDQHWRNARTSGCDVLLSRATALAHKFTKQFGSIAKIQVVPYGEAPSKMPDTDTNVVDDELTFAIYSANLNFWRNVDSKTWQLTRDSSCEMRSVAAHGLCQKMLEVDPTLQLKVVRSDQ